MNADQIFRLAFRLMGLVFLYAGLCGARGLLDIEVIQIVSPSTLASLVLPIVFNLTVAALMIVRLQPRQRISSNGAEKNPRILSTDEKLEALTR